jgi:hypothetical protein
MQMIDSGFFLPMDRRKVDSKVLKDSHCVCMTQVSVKTNAKLAESPSQMRASSARECCRSADHAPGDRTRRRKEHHAAHQYR